MTMIDINKLKEDYEYLKKCESALTLQELVKESTKIGNPPIIAGYLLKLVEESEK